MYHGINALLPLLLVCGAAKGVSKSVLIVACASQDEMDYRSLPDDLIGSAKRWQDWMSLQRPEEEPLPGAQPPEA